MCCVQDIQAAAPSDRRPALDNGDFLRLKESTEREVQRLLDGDMRQLSSQELTALLLAAGYEVDPDRCFEYSNTSNEIPYNARSMAYRDIETKMSFAHVDAPKRLLPILQSVRYWCFVFEEGRIWEL